jgi:elongation factor Ts
MVDIELLKKLRNETLVSLADCRKALEETKNDYKKALDILKKSGLEKAAKKAERETLQGMIDSYIHQNGRVGVLVEVLCETDFVALTDEFKNLVHEVGMQIAAMNPKDVPALLKQEYIRDPKETMELVIKGVIAKLGENIVVKRFQRFEIGE